MHLMGVLGGTFDPVHFGHLRIAVECKDNLGLDELRMLPCARPPHRQQPFASAQQRFDMLQLALKNCNGITADDRELTRQGLSYTVDTLISFKKDFPQSTLFLVVGSDSFQSLASWHQWQKILELANIVIAKRPDSKNNRISNVGKLLSNCFVDDLNAFRHSPCGTVFELHVSQLDISSTEIRHLIGKKKSPQYLLPEPVFHYINQHALYGGDE